MTSRRELELDEVPSHPQVAARRALEPPARRHAPGLGEDTDQVLREFGFDTGRIEALRRHHVI